MWTIVACLVIPAVSGEAPFCVCDKQKAPPMRKVSLGIAGYPSHTLCTSCITGPLLTSSPPDCLRSAHSSTTTQPNFVRKYCRDLHIPHLFPLGSPDQRSPSSTSTINLPRRRAHPIFSCNIRLHTHRHLTSLAVRAPDWIRLWPT